MNILSSDEISQADVYRFVNKYTKFSLAILYSGFFALLVFHLSREKYSPSMNSEM
jgi:hypothetical protein